MGAAILSIYSHWASFTKLTLLLLDFWLDEHRGSALHRRGFVEQAICFSFVFLDMFTVNSNCLLSQSKRRYDAINIIHTERRGHWRGACGHQVAPNDHVNNSRARCQNSSPLMGHCDLRGMLHQSSFKHWWWVIEIKSCILVFMFQGINVISIFKEMKKNYL